MSVIAQCAGCGTKNRLPAGANARCAKCKRPFSPNEVIRAALGERPGVVLKPTPLEDATADDGPTHACKDEDDCGWEGMADELVDDRCPECGKRTRVIDPEEEDDEDY